VEILVKEFKINNWPTKERISELSKLTNLRVTIVARWFKNKFYTSERLLKEKNYY
jgi:hypothetical protein